MAFWRLHALGLVTMKRIISGGTSEISQACEARWRAAGDDVVTTVLRPHMPKIDDCAGWDTLLLSTGTMHPVGPFMGGDFYSWAESFGPNLFLPLDVVKELWPARGENPCVIFFAGAGINGPARDRSSYAVAKAALAKMVELLDDELPEGRFVILSPGWVKTKIQETMPQEPLDPSYWQPIERVASFVAWSAEQPRKVISGRCISIHDGWEAEGFSKIGVYEHCGKMRRSAVPLVGEKAKGRRAA